MNWRLKAAIQRICNNLPVGKQALYRQLQRRWGGLVKGYDHSFLLSETSRMAATLRDVGFNLDNAAVMEVGTGWRLDIPLGLYLCGARRIITCDLNRYLDQQLALDTVRYITANVDGMRALFPFVEQGVLDDRIAKLGNVKSIDDLFRTTGIEYHAPCDCANTTFDDGSIDLHYSYTVFEHIPAPVLEAILREATRLLSDRGVALHHVDLGDHFAQVDSSITPANFLQFSDGEWQPYAGTPWSYHNRLREDDYRALFEKVSHEVVYWKPYIDQPSLDSLKNGFPLAAQFRDKSVELLSIAILDVVSRPRRRRDRSTIVAAPGVREVQG